MSSSEPRRKTATLGRTGLLALSLATALMLGGCIRPLYSENTGSKVGGSVRSALQSVQLGQITGLVGHYLRNELAFELDGGGNNTVAKRLAFEATLTDALEVVTIDYANGRADSAVLIVTAAWKVTRIGTGEVVASGNNIARVPYERSLQRFATVRAARDAQIRAAKSLATLIRGQLSADLTSD